MDILRTINEELQDINNMYSYFPQGYEHKILDETHQSISEIRKLADDVLKKIAADNYPSIQKTNYFQYLYGTNLRYVDSAGYHDLEKFIRESNINILFEPNDDSDIESGTVRKGSYTQLRVKNKAEFNPKSERDISVHYDYNELKESIDSMINEKDKQGRLFSVSDIYAKLYNRFYSTLVHEIQHAYDDYRSGGMAYQTKQYINYLKKYEPQIKDNIIQSQVDDFEKYKAYLNLPHEIWARFSQTIHELQFYDVDFGTHSFIYKMIPMNEVIKRFAYKFNGYRVLSDDMKKKLIRKIAQFWHIEKDRVDELNKEQQMIEKQYSKIQEMVNEEITNMFEGIQVYHGSDRKFDNFDMEKIGSGDGKSLGGWGIYFSDSQDVSNRYVTSSGFLGQYEIRNGSYFDFDETISDGDRIIRGLQRMGIDDTQIEEFQSDFLDYGDVTNRQAYEWLTYVLGGEKQASQFLESLGYLGNTFMDKWDSGARNYVVFNTKSIQKIE